MDQGEVIGVLAGRTDLAGLNQIMIKQTGLGETGETYLVGLNHRLLTHVRLPDYSIPDTYIRTAGTDAAVDQSLTGFATYEGYAGKTVVGVYTWVPDLQVALIAEQEEAEALRSDAADPDDSWEASPSSAVAVVILAGIGLTRSIVRPLAELDTTAGRIAEGELDLRARVVREDEIGRLAHSFNRMTTQLGHLVHSLERRTDHLRAINEAGRQISSILDLDELLPYVARFAAPDLRVPDGTHPDPGPGRGCGPPHLRRLRRGREAHQGLVQRRGRPTLPRDRQAARDERPCSSPLPRRSPETYSPLTARPPPTPRSPLPSA